MSSSPGPESLVVVTGVSGSGKSYVERCFEDIGYFCVDNLPLSLLDALVDDLFSDRTPKKTICIVLDIRNPDFAARFPAAWQRIRARSPGARLIFIDASEDALIRRFSETRRPHPLAEGRSLLEALGHEREMLQEVRALADAVIDTSSLTVHELKNLVAKTFPAGGAEPGLVVALTSFGYKYGAPADLDLLFDVRFLANPHFVPDLRSKTGEDASVAAYIQRDPETAGLLSRLDDLLGYLLPRYEKERKSYLTVGVGCTGGRHRSVYVVERLAESVRARGFTIRVRHRDSARAPFVVG